jgi:hypothetical protein
VVHLSKPITLFLRISSSTLQQDKQDSKSAATTVARTTPIQAARISKK